MTYLTVVVPTRNEADNVEPLVSRVASALQPLDLPWEMLFVDDSDDLTPDRVLEAERAGHPVRLLHRPSPNRVGGLSGAVVLGFEQAAESSIVAVMDGDLQHPPEVLVDLVIAVSSGDADLAIATRPSQLGNGRKGLNRWWRASVSQGARSLVHVAFPRLRVVSDPLAGFFAVHQRVVTDAHLHPEGFKILLELLVRGAWNRIAEIPCPLDPRLHGQSKAGLDQGAAFARHLVRLAACTTHRRSFALRGGEPFDDQDDRPSSPPGELAG